METANRCPSCGEPLDSSAPQGLCQKCLLEAGFPTGTEAGRSASRFVPPTLDELAPRFPQLELLEFVGQGGMGAVYKARQKQLDRIVALKILPPMAAAGPAFAERFTREARALAKLNHPHIITLYEFGQGEGLFYFLMEFVDGLNLRQVLNAGRLAPKEALAIVPQICDALQYAHERGIVHRDIKPENILLNKEGQVKIADFGVAKIVGLETEETERATPAQSAELTHAGSTLGTPQYMAPEQLKNSAEVDHRADIYSLGVVFYQMLTGELPSGEIESPSRKVTIDVRLDEVVLRALEKQPARRYQHVSEIKERVETITQTAAPGPAQHAQTARFAQTEGSRPGSRLAKLLPITGLLILAVAVGFLIRGSRSRSASQAEYSSRFPASAQSNQAEVDTAGQPQPSVLAETWSPTLEPGAKPDLQKILDEAKELTERGQYEAALQRRIWYYNHALETADPYQRIVRLSSSFIDWAELGRRYPKAREALIAIRDRDAARFAAGDGYFELFMELSNINRELQQNKATVDTFKAIQADTHLSETCFPMVSASLVQEGDYELFMKYVPDPQAALGGYRRTWEQNTEMEKRSAAARQRQTDLFQAMQRTNGLPVVLPPIQPPKMADKAFVGSARQLIEALVGVGRKTDAETIREHALAIVDDPQIKSAVADAEARVKTFQSKSKP